MGWVTEIPEGYDTSQLGTRPVAGITVLLQALADPVRLARMRQDSVQDLPGEFAIRLEFAFDHSNGLRQPDAIVGSQNGKARGGNRGCGRLHELASGWFCEH